MQPPGPQGNFVQPQGYVMTAAYPQPIPGAVFAQGMPFPNPAQQQMYPPQQMYAASPMPIQFGMMSPPGPGGFVQPQPPFSGSPGSHGMMMPPHTGGGVAMPQYNAVPHGGPMPSHMGAPPPNVGPGAGGLTPPHKVLKIKEPTGSHKEIDVSHPQRPTPVLTPAPAAAPAPAPTVILPPREKKVLELKAPPDAALKKFQEKQEADKKRTAEFQADKKKKEEEAATAAAAIAASALPHSHPASETPASGAAVPAPAAAENVKVSAAEPSASPAPSAATPVSEPAPVVASAPPASDVVVSEKKPEVVAAVPVEAAVTEAVAVPEISRKSAPTVEVTASAGDEDTAGGGLTPGGEDSWEDKATPNLAAAAGGEDGELLEVPRGPEFSADGRKVYSRDYMKKLAGRELSMQKMEKDNFINISPEYFTDLVYEEPRPKPFEDPAVYLSGRGGRSGANTPSYGGRGGAAAGGGEEWGGRRPPGGGYGGPGDTPRGGRGGGVMGPPGGAGGNRRDGGGGQDWGSRRQPPPPSPANRGGPGGSGRGGVSTLHRTGNRYVAGQTQSADPDEEKKQRTFKGILNKLTIDNFEKLSAQILEVPILDRKTLEGLIDQIFDKALTETGFCEMYASLCSKLANAKDATGEMLLPTFDNPEQPNKRVDLRRLLLNKCQIEFEKGIEADTKVKAREEKEIKGGGAEASTTADGEAPAAADAAAPAAPAAPATAPDSAPKKEGEQLEEGEIPPSPTAAAAEGDAEVKKPEDPKAIAEQERQARRRMLGNMQFIGQLYKYALLTERIMHNCVQQLLQDESLPRPEDIECLCKLLSTVGGKLDGTSKDEFRQRMKVYFERMKRLTENVSLESRIRFMVQDVLDLKDRRWQPRQKVEGPKKIAEVHQDAMRQQQQTEQRNRDENRRGGGGGGGGRRMEEPSPRGGGGGNFNESRMMSRDEVPTRAVSMQRQQSSEVSLRPGNAGGGGYGRGGKQQAPPPAQSAPVRGSPQKAAPAAAPPPPPPPPEPLSEDKLKHKAVSLVEEHWAGNSQADTFANLEDMRKAGASMPQAVIAIVVAALNQRGPDPATRLPPFVDALAAAAEAKVVSPAELHEGSLALARTLHSLTDDFPKAPTLVGALFSKFIVSNIVSLEAVLSAVLDVPPIEEEEEGDSKPPLVAGGNGVPFVLGIMTRVKEAKGDEEAAAIWKASGADLTKFADFESPEDLTAEAEKGKVPFVMA